MRKKEPIILSILLFITAAICGFFFVRAYTTAQNEISAYTEIQAAHTTVVTEEAADVMIAGALPEANGLPYTLADWDALLQANPDTVGWLTIPDTGISYPVVQATDNDRYLDMSFDGERSGAGAIFMDSGNAADPLDSNTIVYGHNMGAGRSDMFGALLSYKDAAYRDAHRYIQFDTIHKQYGWWKVFAVIEHDTRGNAFPYRQSQFKDEADFAEWITTAQALSMYGADADVSPRGHILTLSTCDRSKYGRNGRLLIMAVNLHGSP
jgi:sortase B